MWVSSSGAGQDVGRSCILVSIGGKNIMLDCGMHMGYNDDVSPQSLVRGPPLVRGRPLVVYEAKPIDSIFI